MIWYAIRTVPGSQMPKREFVVETTTRGKKYRIVSSLDPRRSAIEKALSDAKIPFYMPAEYRAVRDRSKTHAYTLRRYPMFPGYVFLPNLRDDEWSKLEKVPGVVGVVCSMDVPLQFGGNGEIIRLLTIEGNSHVTATEKIEKWKQDEDRELRKAATKAVAAAKRRISTGTRVRVMWGKHAGREAVVQRWESNGTIRAILDTLEAGTVVGIPHDYTEIMMQAAE